MTIEWSQDERRVFSLCSFVSSLLSLVGSIFIFISFLAFFKSRWKQITHRLVLSLSLCHLLLSVCWLIGGPLDEVSAVTCQVLAPLRYYLFLASFLWTSVIATEMLSMWYRARVNQFGELVIPQPSSVRQELCYHIAAWGIPLAITIWPTIFHHQEHGLWQCWFEDDYWTFLFLGFVALSCLYCLGVYCLALFKYRTRLYDAGTYSDIQRSKRTEIKFRVTGYLLAFLITWIPLAVLQIMETVDSTRSAPMFVFTVISASLVPLTGFLDSIIYGWDRTLWESLVACLTCSRRRRNRSRSRALLGAGGGRNGRSTSVNGVAAAGGDNHHQYGAAREESTLAFSDSD